MFKYTKLIGFVLVFLATPAFLVLAATASANATASGANTSFATADCVGQIFGYTGSADTSVGVGLFAVDDHQNSYSDNGFRSCLGSSFCSKSVSAIALLNYNFVSVSAGCNVEAFDDVGVYTDYDTDSDI